jgi:uncharacterized protein (TIGR02145 family)
MGWHVPSDGEWQILIDFLGGEPYAGGRMKESGTAHWMVPNNGGSNYSGFTALPGGSRGYNNIFKQAMFWTTTKTTDVTLVWDRQLYYEREDVGRKRVYFSEGLSVRCVKD